MSGLTISDLPPELLYTILSHYLADVLFDYLFLGALLPNHPHNDYHYNDEEQSNATTVEIRSIGRVSVAWRITLLRILGALVHSPNRDNEQVQSHKRLRVRQLTMGIAHAPSTTNNTFINPISVPSSTSTSTQFTTTQIAATQITTTPTPTHTTTPTHHTTTPTPTPTTVDPLSHYLHTLRTMQSALRDLVQHSIDMYRREQDVLSLVNQPQTGVTTPTLLPVPIPIPIPPPPVQVQQVQVPHSTIPGAPGLPIVNGLHNVNGNFTGNGNGNVNDHLFGALLSVAAPALKEYATTPLFQEALCYSQAAIFTCSSSNSFSCCGGRGGVPKTTTTSTATNSSITTTSFSSSSLFANTSTTTTGGASGVRIQRPDLSTLVLTTPRLVSALEWVRTREEGYCRICPREIGDVAERGMREVRERIEDAIQVCRWNDLLNAVFLHGERSEEMIEALDGCFDELEAKAGSIQMHHLLRSNLFKTIQTVARLGPISLVGHASSIPGSGILSSSSPSQSHSQLLSSSSPSLSSSTSTQGSSSCGEVWRSRAGALAFRWMGRVVEWTGL